MNFESGLFTGIIISCTIWTLAICSIKSKPFYMDKGAVPDPGPRPKWPHNMPNGLGYKGKKP